MTEEVKRQSNKEQEDLIRLNVCIENLSGFHSRICNEDFRSKDECRELTNILLDLNRLASKLERNYEIRKQNYYDYDIPCEYPDTLE